MFISEGHFECLGIGMHRYYRISKGQEKQDPGGLNGSQVTTNELKTLSEFINGLPVELGFPCVHRRMKMYLQPSAEDKLDSWSLLHAKFYLYAKEKFATSRVMSYKTFYKYMKGIFPDFSLVKNVEDACDTCVRLKIALKDKTLSAPEIESLKIEQRNHWNFARTQRRIMKEAVQMWGSKELKAHPNGTKEMFMQSLDRLADFREEVDETWNSVPIRDDDFTNPPIILLQAEDYAASIQFFRLFLPSNREFHLKPAQNHDIPPMKLERMPLEKLEQAPSHFGGEIDCHARKVLLSWSACS